MIKTTQLKVGGMTCASCSRAVELALNRVKGVEGASVNLATEKAMIGFDDSVSDAEMFKRAIVDVGYSVVDDEINREEEWEMARKRMLFAWAITIPSMVWMFASMAMGFHWPSPLVMRIGMLILVLPVLAVSGKQTFISAWKSVRHGSANMDMLIVLGTVSAYSTGILQFWLPIGSFTGVAAMIMAFHLTGRYIEKKARGKASQEIRKLLELGAKTAVVDREGIGKEIPLSEVIVGDVMLVKPGARIPTDGVVVDGASAIDESMVTGESMPVARIEGDPVIGATINGSGFLKVRATKVGKETFLSQVIQMVEQAQGSKVPIQLLADRITGWFVPVVIVLAVTALSAHLIFPEIFVKISAWLPWSGSEMSDLTRAIYAMVAVFVIACPCALGLATPTALMVGSGLGAKNGILIRNGEAIQAMKDVRAIVFDKTGTVTQGKPSVTRMQSMDIGDIELMTIAGALESRSEHPLAAAIIDFISEYVEHQLPEVESFASSTGSGVQATVRGINYYAGNAGYMAEKGVDVELVQDDVRQLEKHANTMIYVADSKRLLGYFAVTDHIKDDSWAAIKELKEMGFHTMLLTGDNPISAKAIADAAGIDEVIAQVKPSEKVEAVKGLQLRYGKVAMVGDGINDAPALKQADVGIAMGSGTDIAIESADITLIRSDLSSVVSAVLLSRATFRKIKQNLFWAFFYNLLAIPLAFSGLLHPVVAEIAMAGSSITVVSNANLLRNKNIRLNRNFGS